MADLELLLTSRERPLCGPTRDIGLRSNFPMNKKEGADSSVNIRDELS